ncbi:hypothetical protein [uncultured Mediterranean phage]|nr:hypothetical protein [uncultured Mediterranean phage]
MALLAGLGGLISGIGGIASGVGGIAAAGSGDGFRSRDAIDAGFFRGTRESQLIPGLLAAETALALGASPEAIAEDFIFREAFANSSAGIARAAEQALASARAKLQAGDTVGAQRSLDTANRMLQARKPGTSRSTAAAGQFSIRDGSIVAQVDDPQINGILDQARAQSAEIQEARSGALRQFVTGAGNLGAREDEANDFLSVALQDSFDRIRASEEERANRLGTAPRTQDLNRAFLTQQQQINSGGALERALALLGGEQQVLSTALTPPLLAQQLASSQGTQQNQTGVLSAGVQAADAQARASQARASGLAGALGGLGGVLTSPALGKLLGGGSDSGGS